MLDKINAWDHSKVAYVSSGCIMLGQYKSDDNAPLTVVSDGIIKVPTWTVLSATGANNNPCP